jgi:hypothetical protein
VGLQRSFGFPFPNSILSTLRKCLRAQVFYVSVSLFLSLCTLFLSILASLFLLSVCLSVSPFLTHTHIHKQLGFSCSLIQQHSVWETLTWSWKVCGRYSRLTLLEKWSKNFSAFLSPCFSELVGVCAFLFYRSSYLLKINSGLSRTVATHVSRSDMSFIKPQS